MKTIAPLLLALLSAPALAHCPVPYVITGPGGLAWQIDIDGDLYDGMLPGGTPSALGSMTTWTDTKRLGPSTGTVPIRLIVTDGAHHALCPAVRLNLSGPPRCSEDYDAPGEVPYPVCVPYFTVVQTAPGVYSCSSACQPGRAPAAAYYPPSSAAPALSGLSPASAAAGGAPLAVTVSGSGFNGAAVVRWNGTPLTTYFVGTGAVVALVPGSLRTSPGTASVAVSLPGSTSAALSFTVTP